jgi:hypothetical protein
MFCDTGVDQGHPNIAHRNTFLTLLAFSTRQSQAENVPSRDKRFAAA